MSRHRIVLATASGVASALLLAACGASTDNSASTGAAASAAPATSAPAASTTPADAGGAAMATTSMLMAKKTSDMGTIVTDAKGWTLYRYDKDQASMSMCTDDCTKTWMPVMAEQSSVQGMGVDTAKIGTLTRSDGMKQLTLAGWPLYKYMGDTKAGDMNGQGKGDAWYAVAPTGTKVAMAASSGSSGTKGTTSGSSGSMSGMPGM